ncbi:UDP-2,4-diacetamido-2,4,6-trideoxy-beta-L-altropyranose hydrolase [Alteromonadaceae bacterium BrNp21-10]|nr:UDP-2,4-diacetamido-2,4,6-trideoxy-beta-L-altropyranose hydrolase [Alteromonadaceae bacterium BrNp21-10]
MKALFRVDASADIGLGHLMRCLALAQTLARENFEIIFVCQHQTQNIALSRQDWVGGIVVIPEGFTQAQELDWLAMLNEMQQADVVIIDGYQFDSGYRQRLRAMAKKLVVFDDNNNSGELHGDLVINGANNAAELGYKISAPNAQYCLGSDYRILRQEFIQLDEVPWSQRHSLCIMMGGSDPLNITLPLLEALQQQNASMPIRVMTGAAYPFMDDLQAFIRQSPMAIQHLANCQQVAEIVSQSRLAISAAGGSQFEILACHTPTMLMVVADNQRNATLQSAKQGWCDILEANNQALLHDHFPAIAIQIMLLWDDEAKLMAMHQQTQQHADTQGCQRVLQAMQNMLAVA